MVRVHGIALFATHLALQTVCQPACSISASVTPRATAGQGLPPNLGWVGQSYAPHFGRLSLRFPHPYTYIIPQYREKVNRQSVQSFNQKKSVNWLLCTKRLVAWEDEPTLLHYIFFFHPFCFFQNDKFA